MNPRTLIIPDIHEQIDTLDRLAPRIQAAKRVVYLGDWFDRFGTRRPRRVAERYKAALHNRKTTCLLGNHDCQYAFRHEGFKCSGYDAVTGQVTQDVLTRDDWARARLWTTVGPYLVSHAGFCEATLQYRTEEVHNEVLSRALDGGYDPLFEPGYARGGNAVCGGPTWLDWSELIHMPNVPQIVGHTCGSTVRTKGKKGHKSYCLDTALRTVAWVDERTGHVEVERI